MMNSEDINLQTQSHPYDNPPDNSMIDSQTQGSIEPIFPPKEHYFEMILVLEPPTLIV